MVGWREPRRWLVKTRVRQQVAGLGDTLRPSAIIGAKVTTFAMNLVFMAVLQMLDRGRVPKLMERRHRSHRAWP